MLTVAATGPGSPNPTLLLLLVAALVVVWLVQRATARRNAARCARYGHAPDPTTVGTRGERCARCGLRLR